VSARSTQAGKIDHAVEELPAQRVFSIARGYADANKRYGETTKTIDTDIALVAHPILQISNALLLRRILKLYFDYYERSRTHLSLAKDAPIHRPIQPPALGKVIALPQVGGLHHRYERRAA
jgi:hypothetical protein